MLPVVAVVVEIEPFQGRSGPANQVEALKRHRMDASAQDSIRSNCVSPRCYSVDVVSDVFVCCCMVG